MPAAKRVRLLLKILSSSVFVLILTGFGVVKPAKAERGTDAAPAATAPSAPSPPPPTERYQWRRTPDEAAANRASADDGKGALKVDSPKGQVHSWETGAGKSYLIPAWEVPTFLLLLNLVNRTFFPDDYTNGKRTYATGFVTTWDQLEDQDWAFDKDPFNVNQFAHPYQGSMMYGFARSAGLGFWESWAYSNVGSFIWKMAGETGPPSTNDMITTGNAGSLLGEALFRMSQLVLKEQHGPPDGWHELGAAIVSPPTGFNRLAFGDRFKPVFPSHDPATFWRFRLGAMFDHHNDATLDFAMSYGLPGRIGYSYRRPLDYFDFQISGIALEDNPVGTVLLRGLLHGKQYEAGENYRGIWGLYGSYDFISPSIFRVSSTALSLGTTAQYWMAQDVALQGSVLGGVGFGAAGVTPVHDGSRDYHYGVTPQGMTALRLILGDRVSLETSGRGYWVTGTGSDNAQGDEAIVHASANLIWRVFRRHGLGLQFVESVRNAKYGNLPSRHQSNATFGIFYTFLGDTHLGAVEWRDIWAR